MADPIRQALLNALHGKLAHVSPTVALEELTATQARRRPRRGLATIWEQLAHMVFWQDIMLARIRGEMPPHPKTAAEGWPKMPPVRDSEAEWSDLVHHFQAGLREAEQAARRKPLGAKMGPKAKRTHGDQLMSMASHNSYHIGQIVTLRRMLGLWPPPSGGETW